MKYLELIWLRVFKDKTGSAPMDKVWEMVQEANVPIYYCYFEKLFKEIDVDNKKTFEYKDFKKLVTLALEHKEELGKLFEKYCADTSLAKRDEEDSLIKQAELNKFMKEVQKEQLSYHSCDIIIQVVSSFLFTEYGNLKKLTEKVPNINAFQDISATETRDVAAASEKKALDTTNSYECARGLNLMGFSNMIFAKSNCAFSDKTYTPNLQNPLGYYLINTSYYTYFKIDPETHLIEATAKNYSKYLLKGVRCVDIGLIVYLVFLLCLEWARWKSCCWSQEITKQVRFFKGCS